MGIYNLFVESFEGWDQVGNFDIQVYGAVLKVEIGRFAVGDKVEVLSLVLMDQDKCMIQIYQDGKCYESEIVFDITFSGFKEVYA